MNVSRRSVYMLLTLVALSIFSAFAPHATAAKASAKEEVVHVQWNTTEAEYKAFQSQLQDLDVQTFTDGAVAPYADVPVSESFTSKDMSGADLAAWVRDQASNNMAAACTVIRVAIRIDTPIGPITGQIIIRICNE